MGSRREDVFSCLNRTGYKKASVYFGMCPALIEKMHNIFGDQSYNEYFDFEFVVAKEPKPKLDYNRFRAYYQDLPSDAEIDYTGVAHIHGSDSAFHMTRLVHPLKGVDSPEAVKEYPFADFESLDYSETAKDVENIRAKDRLSIGHLGQTIWEKAWAIRSMEELMVDLLTENGIGEYILDQLTDCAVIRARKYAESDVDLIWLGDDVGMQQSTMMSKEMYCEILKPRLAKVIASAKAVKPDVKIVYHSCGYVLPFIEDFIEAGIDILNPIQPECMDFQKIHDRFGDTISFWGGIGTQSTMPKGTPQDVRDRVKTCLDIAGERGGLICTPSHLLEPEVPVENILAYVEAVRNYK